MAESDHPIPNLSALRAKLSPGLAVELVDALADVDSIENASEILSNRLRARVAAIEEGLDATTEVA